MVLDKDKNELADEVADMFGELGAMIEKFPSLFEEMSPKAASILGKFSLSDVFGEAIFDFHIFELVTKSSVLILEPEKKEFAGDSTKENMFSCQAMIGMFYHINTFLKRPLRVTVDPEVVESGIDIPATLLKNRENLDLYFEAVKAIIIKIDLWYAKTHLVKEGVLEEVSFESIAQEIREIMENDKLKEDFYQVIEHAVPYKETQDSEKEAFNSFVNKFEEWFKNNQDLNPAL